MKLAYKFFAVGAALYMLAATGSAQNLVGMWKGKVQIDMSKLPKGLSPEQQKMMEKGLAMAKNMVIRLDLRANKTYTASVTGMPAMASKNGKQASEGNWRVQGNTLWLTSVKENGKPATSKHPQQFTIAKDGRSFFLNTPGGQGGKVVFTR